MSDGSEPLLLGVDGGGTSTIAWLGRPGRVVGRGRAGACNAKAVGLDAARRALNDAIGAAYSDAGQPRSPAAVGCLGLAGFGRPEDRETLKHWNAEDGWADRILAVTDGDLVVAAGTPEGWGIGVIAGTGSIAVGRAQDGRLARSGGWGYLIGDEGSAYTVALAALRLVVRRADGRDRAPSGDPLTRELCAALGVSGPSGIVPVLYAPEFDRKRIAGLAPAVLAAAKEDVDVTDRVLRPAGVALAELVAAVAGTLGWHSGNLPLAAAGSFLLGAGAVREAMIDALSERGYHTTLTPVPEPVSGALILAGRAILDHEKEAGPAPG